MTVMHPSCPTHHIHSDMIRIDCDLEAELSVSPPQRLTSPSQRLVSPPSPQSVSPPLRTHSHTLSSTCSSVCLCVGECQGVTRARQTVAVADTASDTVSVPAADTVSDSSSSARWISLVFKNGMVKGGLYRASSSLCVSICTFLLVKQVN